MYSSGIVVMDVPPGRFNEQFNGFVARRFPKLQFEFVEKGFLVSILPWFRLWTVRRKYFVIHDPLNAGVRDVFASLIGVED